MNLLLVARRFPPDVRSGTETVFENLWSRARARHVARLVAGWVHDRALLPAEALGVDLRGHRLGTAHVAMVRAVAGEVRRSRPDVILSNAIEVPDLGVPTAIIVHDLNFGGKRRGLGSWLRERLYQWRCRRAEAIITPSRATRDALVRIGVDRERITVIANGVDLEEFRPIARASAAEPVILAYPGRILPGKGQHVAIDAVARLDPAERQRVRLDIVGTVADPAYLAQLRVQARGLPVAFHTDVAEIAPFYQRADLVLFPTLMREGFGYTAVEAMACARPVVFTDQPALREATSGIGFPVSPDDPRAIRDVIRRRLADRVAFERVGAEGRDFVERWYGWDRVWGSYERVLEGIRRA